MKRCSVSLLRDTVSHLLDQQRSKSWTTGFADRDVGENTLSGSAGPTLTKENLTMYIKIRNYLLFDPAIPLVGIFLKIYLLKYEIIYIQGYSQQHYL